MLDTRQTDEALLRCAALLDRIAATPMGRNVHALSVTLAECGALERVLHDPATICKLRDVRHWLRLAYGATLHGYPPDALRQNLLAATTALVRSIKPAS